MSVEVISVEEAGKLLDPPIGRASMYRWAKQGFPGLIRVNRSLFVVKVAFLRGLDALPQVITDDIREQMAEQRLWGVSDVDIAASHGFTVDAVKAALDV